MTRRAIRAIDVLCIAIHVGIVIACGLRLAGRV